MTYILVWTKQGARLSERMEDNSFGTLTIRNVQPEDAGTYVCTGSNTFGIDTDEARLIVGGKGLVILKDILGYS